MNDVTDYLEGFAEVKEMWVTSLVIADEENPICHLPAFWCISLPSGGSLSDVRVSWSPTSRVRWRTHTDDSEAEPCIWCWFLQKKLDEVLKTWELAWSGSTLGMWFASSEGKMERSILDQKLETQLQAAGQLPLFLVPCCLSERTGDAFLEVLKNVNWLSYSQRVIFPFSTHKTGKRARRRKICFMTWKKFACGNSMYWNAL